MGDGNRVAIGIAIRIVMVIGMWGGGTCKQRAPSTYIHLHSQLTCYMVALYVYVSHVRSFLCFFVLFFLACGLYENVYVTCLVCTTYMVCSICLTCGYGRMYIVCAM